MIINKKNNTQLNIYNNYILFFDILYKHLNSQFSKAYLSGSIWYIGDSLINNPEFIFPPYRLLCLWGVCREKDIIKSQIIIYILILFCIKNYT